MFFITEFMLKATASVEGDNTAGSAFAEGNIDPEEEDEVDDESSSDSNSSSSSSEEEGELSSFDKAKLRIRVCCVCLKVYCNY